MKLVIILLCAVVSTLSAPAFDTPIILRYENNNYGAGGYEFAFETSDGISRQEKQEGNVVQGSYSYTGPDGIFYTVNYIADENGFQPSGDHIPVIPIGPETYQTQGQPGFFGNGKRSINNYVIQEPIRGDFRAKRQGIQIIKVLLKKRLFK